MYSQSNEEAVILSYFGERRGTFLDIGANDGITLSNTRALAELGWCGVCVEPSPKAFRKLKSLYESANGKKKCFYVYECAIGNHNGKAILHESGPLLGVEDVALVSTLDEKETERFKRTVKYEPVEVKVFKWKTFYNRLYIKDFNFISLDVEGLELDILKQMDVSKTEMICVETNGSAEKKKELDELLTGFKVIYKSPENLIYAR